MKPCFSSGNVLEGVWRHFVTHSSKKEVKNQENNIYLVDNPVDLHDIQDANRNQQWTFATGIQTFYASATVFTTYSSGLL